MYYPSFDLFREKSKEGNLIPVYREILADLETPVSAFLKIDKGEYSFLLESVEGGEKWARYCFLGVEPSIVFMSKGKEIRIIRDGDVEEFTVDKDPLDSLKRLMSEYRYVETEGIPRFFGGAVGYIGYDIIRFFEELPEKAKDDLKIPDSVFIITDTILIFDNVTQKIKIVSNAHITDGNLQDIYNNAKEKIDSIILRLKEPLRRDIAIKGVKGDNKRRDVLKTTSNISREGFEKVVLRSKRYIRDGDIIQVVLSQRLKTRINGDPFNIYRALRTINPSPYMYYLKLGDMNIIGSSPEVLVRLDRGQVELRPIAGTRRRGATESEDIKLAEELLNDSKEKAEHIMLVDLGRNDLGRVAKIKSVEVNELMVIERYSHVMHIVSNIRGDIEEGLDCFDVIRATFPAGTVSGAPKIRAMEIIEELEPTRRGLYAGAVGYFSFSGNMDMAIAIRTIIIKDKTAYLGIGAGIVADSKPANEYEETMNKGKALLKAIEMAERYLGEVYDIDDRQL
ncbi:MAG: anthranilate synthase component I [Nitrospinae bacterium]|nr:anthranilate synthase component I [Nitrospinota bacterium]